MIIHANLDCEARWAGVTLPAHVLAKISAIASLTAALVDGEAEVWAPAAVEPGRLRGWTAPAMRVGTPPRADLAWADPRAKPANDRRLALAVAEAAGAGVEGSRVVASIDELDAHLAATAIPRWVCKAPWTTAGRDRCHGHGPVTAEPRAHLARMLARFGAVVFEPWLDRMLDFGVCASVAGDAVTASPPHQLLCDARGGFLGIDLAPPDLTASERDRIDAVVEAAGRALAALGYAGPFAIDGFAYAEDHTRRLRPLVEINARHTFGHVARALAARLGVRRLGFTPAPPGATVLVAPTERDATTAWVFA